MVHNCIGWLVVAPDEFLKLCRQETYQGSGPGGQKRNRVYSGIRLYFERDGIRLTSTSSENRESSRNLKSALYRLRLDLALECSRLCSGENQENSEIDSFKNILSGLPGNWPEMRTGVNENHDDLPRFVFLYMLSLRIASGDAVVASRNLGLTTSSYVRFLKINKRVWNEAQQLRSLYGRPLLK